MKPLRIGIVGVGIIGKHHLEEYAKIAGVEIVAVCDIDQAERQRVSEKHAIPHQYSEFRALFERDDLDAIDVCVHNNLHAPIAIAALQSGKHVFCEKPMAGSYKDALAMKTAATQTGKMLSIQLATLFTRETRIARRLIEAGRLGEIYHARSSGFRRRGRPYVDGYATPDFVRKPISGGGALYDMGVYHIAQLLYLLGLPEIERVTGKVYQKTDMDATRREISGYSVEELGTGYIRCAGDLTIDLIEAWAIHLDKLESSSIVGAKGGLRLSPLSFHSTEEDLETNMTFEEGSIDWRWHQLQPEIAAYDSPQKHWVAALQGRVPLLPTADIALRTMLISEGIYLSSRLGREVTKEEIETMAISTALPL